MSAMAADPLDMDQVREIFEASTDFTIGLEEEFAIVDPQSLELAHRFVELEKRSSEHELLADSVAGELIDTEIEIRSGRGETFADAFEQQSRYRAALFGLAEEMGLALAATGTHPWADYLDQQIIDTPHYNRLAEDLQWVARRNNTWSLHLHIGIRGADRAIAVCDRMREMLPLLLAVSANSPFLDRRDTGLHSVRTEIFTRVFPRCGIPSAFRTWSEYAGYIRTLRDVNSIVEPTQLWWSVRPHHRFGTVELRICDAQVRGDESASLLALLASATAQAAIDYDEGGYDGTAGPPLHDREIEENLWRAIRYGMDGKLVDFRRRTEVEARQALDEFLEWSAAGRELLGVEVRLPDANGAQRALGALADGSSIEEIYREAVAETKSTYGAGELVG
jgi:glutamate---cysteine ligase / carboxylate-amine ligase